MTEYDPDKAPRKPKKPTHVSYWVGKEPLSAAQRAQFVAERVIDIAVTSWIGDKHIDVSKQEQVDGLVADWEFARDMAEKEQLLGEAALSDIETESLENAEDYARVLADAIDNANFDRSSRGERDGVAYSHIIMERALEQLRSGVPGDLKGF